ncbi:ATP-binding cassette domain-containing protein [Microbacterium sp. ACRRU]|uniref:ATP-binding cassette domain-containing protein n=1 Tax=Microbacterium sp. ACRRU TaxID=2918204 RepID=UPI0027DEC412|nr:ATP-binding cassette domain-containing protein [Microbacterium sp. ACRRU]
MNADSDADTGDEQKAQSASPRKAATTSAPRSPRAASAKKPTTPRATAEKTPAASRASGEKKPATPRASGEKKPATPRSTAAKKPATPRTGAAKKPATPRATAAKKPATPRTAGANTPPVEPIEAETTPVVPGPPPPLPTDLVVPPRPPLPVPAEASDEAPAETEAPVSAVVDAPVPASAGGGDDAAAPSPIADPTPSDVAVEEPPVEVAETTGEQSPRSVGESIPERDADLVAPEVADAEAVEAARAAAEPVDVDVADAEPGDAEPANAEPANAEPAEAEPVEPEPGETELDEVGSEVDERAEDGSLGAEASADVPASRQDAVDSEYHGHPATTEDPTPADVAVEASAAAAVPDSEASADGDPREASTDDAGATTVDHAVDKAAADDTDVPALSLRNVTKTFGELRAVDGVDLTVPAGSFYGLVGPNGAGKTTTLSIIAGLLRSDAGTVEINGVDAARQSRVAKKMIGVLPDRLRTFDRLTGRQLLSYYGALRGLPAPVVESRAADLARAFDLVDALGRPVSDYSAGMTKKVMLAGAMIHSPRLLVLDEPFEAVDPVSSAVILDILRAYVDHGGTVILSSHGMELVERVCSRVAVIVSGQVLAEGTIDEVRGESTLEQRFLELSGGLGDVEGLEWLHTFSA